jgi:biopolymer transport protein ExbD/biopolymer transport protein TolR
MGMLVGGKRGTITEMNVVPLIDILLVLLVIFMVIPHTRGLKAEIPQPADTVVVEPPSIIVVQVLADGTLRINQEPVAWDSLQSRLEEVFKLRADHTAFIRGDASVEFSVVARVIDVMNTAGIAPIGLLTQQMGNGL